MLLTAPHNSGEITSRVSAETIDIVRSKVGSTVNSRWLCAGDAFEVLFPLHETLQAELNGLRQELNRVFLGRAIDINILFRPLQSFSQPKKLLVADMESTIIQEEMLDELASETGIGDAVANITARAMRGEIEFSAALRERVNLLKGLTRQVLDRVGNRMTLMPGALTLIATMKANGAYCALVSGGFDFFCDPIAQRVGFHEHQANGFIFDGHVLTGEVREPILGQDAKLEALKRLCAARKIELSDAIAVGDGANDLAMLTAAGLGVAFRAKPVVTERVPISLRHTDLRGVLYLQGLSSDEFVSPAGEHS